MNPLRVHIASHDTVSAVCAAVNPTHLILIVDHGDSFHIPEVANRLVLQFNDYENGEPHGPEHQHAEAALGFVATLRQPSDLVVACTYGQSRSSAIALAVSAKMIQKGQWIPEMNAAYADLAGTIAPNRALIRYLGNGLGISSHHLLKITATRLNLIADGIAHA